MSDPQTENIFILLCRVAYRDFRMWLSFKKDEWKHRLGLVKPVPKGKRATVTFENYTTNEVTPEPFRMTSPEEHDALMDAVKSSHPVVRKGQFFER